MGRNLVFLLLCVSLVLVEAVFFGIVALSSSRRSRRWELTEEKFQLAVCESVSNYLSKVAFPSESSSTLSSSIVPEFKLVDGLGIWFSPRRGYCCRIGRNDFRVGDYCEYGLIVQISSGRVYVRDGQKVVILRQAPDAAGALATAAPEPAGGALL